MRKEAPRGKQGHDARNANGQGKGLMMVQHHIARQRHDEQLQRVADGRPQQHFYKFHRHDKRRDAAQE